MRYLLIVAAILMLGIIKSPAPSGGGGGGTTVSVSSTNASYVVITNGQSLVTNNQVLVSAGNYYIPAGVSARIDFTNAGVMFIYGDGIITTNILGMGATARIQCHNYCPNGGQTLFNWRSNMWRSVTCEVSCVTADINDSQRSSAGGLPTGEEGGNTTNQADVFIVNAGNKINFYEWETKRFNTTTKQAFYAPIIKWSTFHFDASFISDVAPLVPTLNAGDGSEIKAELFEHYCVTPGVDLSIQLWNNYPYTNVLFIFDVGALIPSRFQNSYSKIFPSITVSANSISNRFTVPINNGIYLPRVTYDGDQISGSSGLENGSISQNNLLFFGSFYEPINNTIYNYSALNILSGISGNGSNITSLNASQLTVGAITNAAILGTNAPLAGSIMMTPDSTYTRWSRDITWLSNTLTVSNGVDSKLILIPGVSTVFKLVSATSTNTFSFGTNGNAPTFNGIAINTNNASQITSGTWSGAIVSSNSSSANIGLKGTGGDWTNAGAISASGWMISPSGFTGVGTGVAALVCNNNLGYGFSASTAYSLMAANGNAQRFTITNGAGNMNFPLTASNFVAQTGIATQATNLLSFSSVSALTNTMGRDAYASFSGGTSITLQDTNGNTVDVIGTIATLHLIVPMRINMRATGTAMSAVLY